MLNEYSLNSISESLSLTMTWRRYSLRITQALASGWVTPSTTKRASSSLLATSNELPYPWRGSQYKMTSSPTSLRTGRLTSLKLWSFWRRFRVMYRRPMNQSPDTTVATPAGAEANALSSPLPKTTSRRAITGESSEGAVGPRA